MCYDSHDTPKVMCGMHTLTHEDEENAVEGMRECLSEYCLSIGDAIYGVATCVWEKAHSDDGVMDYVDKNGMAFRLDGMEAVFVGRK